MLKTLFADQRNSLNQFFDSLDVAQSEKILEVLKKCRGIVIFSGVGKSGHVAEKISATFSSTGTRSFFLSPSNALHGDIGFVTREDIFISLSKSGESAELIHLLPHIQKRGAATIAVVSAAQSTLARLSDHTVVLPIQKEICPYGLAPTTSAAIQLIFGDCLAVALMQAKQFSVADFAANHPSGILGRKITFTVADLMLKGESLPLCKPTDPLLHVLHELSIKRCGCLLIADEEKNLLGIFTDGDLRRALEQKGADALHFPLSQLMHHSPKTISAKELALAAVQKMEEDPAQLVTVLPVVEGRKIAGLIRMHDILQKEFK